MIASLAESAHLVALQRRRVRCDQAPHPRAISDRAKDVTMCRWPTGEMSEPR